MEVVKRDGRRVPFVESKIEGAIAACLQAVGVEHDSNAVLKVSIARVRDLGKQILTIEEIQIAVIASLMELGLQDAAYDYIQYKTTRDIKRGRDIPEDVREAFDSNAQWFPTPEREFQFYDKYARWSKEKGRRETWEEAIDRVTDYLGELYTTRLDSKGLTSEELADQSLDVPAVKDRLRTSMLNMTAMPSMRALAMAGPAARKNNAAIYNCSFLGVDNPYAMVETLILLMCGCGVGFSVEDVFLRELPPTRVYDGRRLTPGDLWIWGDCDVPYPCQTFQKTPGEQVTHVVEDSAIGWAKALATGLAYWWNGADCLTFDYSQIRKAGTVLETKGGTASGPGPLKNLLAMVKNAILLCAGDLRSIDVHDIQCSIGDCVVQGGVRRSAMISLFDWDDQDMWNAKTGSWFKSAPWRQNANNSVVFPDRRLTQKEVIEFVLHMDSAGYGEPGIFSRRAALATMPKRRLAKMSSWDQARVGCNPCGEILNRHRCFCNLSIVVSRPGDTYEDLEEKLWCATVLGTLQSTATHFPGLRDAWRKNAEQERLLGVDITGQADRPWTDEEFKSGLELVLDTNRFWAQHLGINVSAATTCVKPGGNSSVLLGCSPGMNRRWSPYQVRNIRVGANGPLFKLFKHFGVPMDPENGQTAENADRWVVHFPMKAPDGSKTTRDITAIQQCELWLQNKIFWTEHNPSVTITYKPDELLPLMQWIYENQDILGGMAFLPALDHKYEQAPNVEISEEEFLRRSAEFPTVDYARLYSYEVRDTTTSAQELACMGGTCLLE